MVPLFQCPEEKPCSEESSMTRSAGGELRRGEGCSAPEQDSCRFPP